MGEIFAQGKNISTSYYMKNLTTMKN